MGLLDRIRRSSTPPAAPRTALFDDEFQRKLEMLAIVSRRVFSGRMRAERRSKKKGSGVEFADHRDYVPGDDFRYVDWNVFQRFGRLLVRLYEEEEDLGIYFLIDCSKSMTFGGAKKFDQARKMCAALAYVGLANLDRVTIVALNDQVNHAIEPVTDLDNYGKAEWWAYPTNGKGDCEDYVLLKRKLLIDAGWPRSALLITVVRDKKGDGHAVLMVKTDRGEFVLDNQEQRVLPWRETGYRYVKRQSQMSPNVWVSLGDTQTTSMVAAKGE
jgi:predicted transglutaminase-like cysteine proteinase